MFMGETLMNSLVCTLKGDRTVEGRLTGNMYFCGAGRGWEWTRVRMTQICLLYKCLKLSNKKKVSRFCNATFNLRKISVFVTFSRDYSPRFVVIAENSFDIASRGFFNSCLHSVLNKPGMPPSKSRKSLRCTFCLSCIVLVPAPPPPSPHHLLPHPTLITIAGCYTQPLQVDNVY